MEGARTFRYDFSSRVGKGSNEQQALWTTHKQFCKLPQQTDSVDKLSTMFTSEIEKGEVRCASENEP